VTVSFVRYEDGTYKISTVNKNRIIANHNRLGSSPLDLNTPRPLMRYF